MELESRPGFERARERWAKFWKGECADRPIVNACIPKPGVEPVTKPRPYHLLEEDCSTDERRLDEFADQLIRWAETHEFLGDLIPGFQVTFGPDHFALLLGADMEYRTDSTSGSRVGWVTPFLRDYGEDIRFKAECHWWEKTVQCVRALRKRCDGKVLISWTHFQGGLDALAAIRGPQELLTDLVLRPDDVRDALRRIDRAVDDARRPFAEELDIDKWGCVNRHEFYAHGWIDIPQCDFSCMISPEMFLEFGIPSLVSDCETLVGCNYHLDGPDAIRHLPALCEIEKIKTIQWQPGPRHFREMDWSDLYRDIDARGKGHIRGGTMEEVKAMGRLYKSPYMRYSVNGLTSRRQAEDFLGELESIKA